MIQQMVRRARRRPRLSLVVVVFDMPTQAMNTIRSLSPEHQRDVTSRDYEVVVVENRSANLLDPTGVTALGPNITYLLRDEPGQSPAPAMNAGARAARAEVLALLVDGARMVSPGVVATILAAQRLAAEPVVSVPGYHLGRRLHQEAVLDGYSAEQEQQALADLDWICDGYRLFDMAVLSASCAGGFLRPIGESNCIAVSRRLFDRLGGFDEGFTTMGGGFVNLDFYRRAVDSGTLILLPGEGTFHQFHGGATTGAEGVDRDALLEQMHAEYTRLRGQVHAPPAQAPILLGQVSSHAAPFLRHSVDAWVKAGEV